jgi:hypothetical protein
MRGASKNVIIPDESCKPVSQRIFGRLPSREITLHHPNSEKFWGVNYKVVN